MTIPTLKCLSEEEIHPTNEHTADIHCISNLEALHSQCSTYLEATKPFRKKEGIKM
jgi:hypothetical protein